MGLGVFISLYLQEILQKWQYGELFEIQRYQQYPLSYDKIVYAL